jgi:diaminohydroxyphosphoribosylaminopyrimidine deaminase/5-amino-6-(5-phosphoribosylamino)uracil reductase
MADFAPIDFEMMARALSLAGRGMYTAHPNPRVGCLLVREGRVIGEGWHRRTGEEHAEVNALADAGIAAEGSIAYVTLEPCSHHGRTPPCVDALVKAGVRQVFVAMNDPNPAVAGEGVAALRKAGIDVRVGLMAAEAESLNEGFKRRMTKRLPFVRLKIAASLDGATSMKSGESKWITGDESRQDVQKLRASSGAILSGVETVLMDDPALTVRGEFADNGGRQPIRVILDSRLRMPPTAKMLGLPGRTVVFCVDDSNRRALEGAGAIVVRVAEKGGRPDLVAVLHEIADMEVNDLLVEAGATLVGAFLMERRVDELVIYQAPHIMGSETHGIANTPDWLKLDQRFALRFTEASMIGRDLLVRARPAN